jgi:hypothetical protein
MAEQMIEATGVQLCAETFGDRAHPPILLIMDTGASMLWWEDGFCRLLTDGGRFVIRLRPLRHRPFGHLRTATPRIQRC